MARDYRGNNQPLTARDVTLIAVAFELQRDLVLADLNVVSDWSSNEQALCLSCDISRFISHRRHVFSLVGSAIRGF